MNPALRMSQKTEVERLNEIINNPYIIPQLQDATDKEIITGLLCDPFIAYSMKKSWLTYNIKEELVKCNPIFIQILKGIYQCKSRNKNDDFTFPLGTSDNIKIEMNKLYQLHKFVHEL